MTLSGELNSKYVVFNGVYSIFKSSLFKGFIDTPLPPELPSNIKLVWVSFKYPLFIIFLEKLLVTKLFSVNLYQIGNILAGSFVIFVLSNVVPIAGSYKNLQTL